MIFKKFAEVSCAHQSDIYLIKNIV